MQGVRQFCLYINALVCEGHFGHFVKKMGFLAAGKFVPENAYRALWRKAER